MNDECATDAEPHAELAIVKENDGTSHATSPAHPAATGYEDQSPMNAGGPPPIDLTEPDTGTAAGATPGVTQTLKLVLTLRPAEGPRLRALLAVGADGCDPLIRSLPSDDLPAALAAVPALVAEAEARWAAQPRYPVATPPSANMPARGRKSSDARHSPSGDAPSRDPAFAPPTDPPEDRPVAEPRADDAAQLSLFEQR